MLIRWSAPGPGGREYERLYKVEGQFRSLLNKRVRPRQKHQALMGMGPVPVCLSHQDGPAPSISAAVARQLARRCLRSRTPLALPRLAGGGLAAVWRGPSGGLAGAWCRADGGLAVVWRGAGGGTGSVRAERLLQPGGEPGQAHTSTTGGKRGPEGSGWERIKAQRISSI
jgi:hypothetical protein